jgi:cyclic pyranopterin phosphate synthase
MPDHSPVLPDSDPALPLIDAHGRQVTYLRLSITDRCDFRCTYCMNERMQFVPRDQVLSLEECLRLVRIFTTLGISKLRITGGEPLVRPNALWLLQRLGELPGLAERVLTTNGAQLAEQAQALKAAGITRLNISLDSLDPQRFAALTRTGRLAQVLAGIEAARDAGFARIRLNVLLLRGQNEDEAEALLDFALARQLDIAFIEEMPLGIVADRRQSCVSNVELRRRLQKRYALLPSSDTSGGPARYWRLAGTQSRIGFISPHSENFCASCNRVRVSATGTLYPCLGDAHAQPLLPLLRRFPDDDLPMRAAIRAALRAKPATHDFTRQMATPGILRFMSTTGG